jgi:hypothetical protein
MLVKDEDCHIESAVRNVMGFCDLLIIADNYSQDQTYPILQKLASEYPSIQLMRVAQASESHPLVEPFVNTSTWIFGIDGDEIYDPAGLKILREKILAGEYDEYWEIFGNVLHCASLDKRKMAASGWLASPALSMTKLYNFSKILQWSDCPQRLHWGTRVFKEEPYKSLMFCDDIKWDQSIFRCLHVAFIRRSSLQSEAAHKMASRLNLSEIKRNTQLDWSLGIKHVLKQLFVYPITRIPAFDYKHRRYRKGPVVEVDASSFFPCPTSQSPKIEAPDGA